MHEIKKNKVLLALAGQKQIGKSTVAKYLNENYSFKRSAFAKRLKDFVDSVFNFIDLSDAAKELDVHCLIQEQCLYSEIIKLAVPKEDVEQLVQSFISVLAYHSKFGIVPCDIGFYITISRRLALQLIGSEWARDYDEMFWIYRTDITSAEKIVVEDLRFPNELDFIKRQGGTIIKIERGGIISNDTHISELGIPDRLCDVIVTNEGSLELLYKRIDEIMENVINK